MIKLFLKISLKKIKMETKNQKIFVEEMNSKLMVEALKYKQTSQPKMISKILNCLQLGIKEESYLPLYPTNSKQME